MELSANEKKFKQVNLKINKFTTFRIFLQYTIYILYYLNKENCFIHKNKYFHDNRQYTYMHLNVYNLYN